MARAGRCSSPRSTTSPWVVTRSRRSSSKRDSRRRRWVINCGVMPEGDTIHRAAKTLQIALAGRVITRFETMFPQLARVDEDAPLVGRTIDAVEAAGKNLLMHFSGD